MNEPTKTETPLEHFDKFFKLMADNKDYSMSEYNGNVSYYIRVYDRRFTISFDKQEGYVVYEDIEWFNS